MAKLRLLLLGLILSSVTLATETPPADVRTYDQNPRHLWNRVHQALFIRVAVDGTTYGHDRLDPLFWPSTQYLLEERSHRKAIEVLDEFLENHGERLIHDPLKRAFLQHDLWTLFDWSASPSVNRHQRERVQLQVRLAQVIRRLALTSDKLNSLPDNYSRAQAANIPTTLPQGLFLRDGDWVNVTASGGVAPQHMQNFGGRSTFHVLLRLPKGRAETLAYIERLRSFERPWVYVESISPQYSIVMNPAMPQFPSGTEWALVRRMRIIDATGNIRPTPIVESIQLRRYTFVPQDARFDSYEAQLKAQEVFEFVTSRAGQGDLREVRPGERDFYQFQAHDLDPFELSAESLSTLPGSNPLRSRMQRDILRSCMTCHAAPGIHSVQSLQRITHDRLLSAPKLTQSESADILQEVVRWESYQYGLLRGFWDGLGRP